MPKSVQNKDIEYQPPVQRYSYSYSSPGLQKILIKKSNTFFILSVFIGLFFLIIILLGILNFFNVLPLSTIFPKQLGFLPHISKANNTAEPKPVFLPATNSWVAQGTLYRYNDNQIEVKVGKTIVKLEFSSQNSMFYKSQTLLGTNSTQSATTTNIIPYTLYDLDQKENLNKTVEVRYFVDKSGKNIIQTITLFN